MAAAADELDIDNATLRRNLGKLADALAGIRSPDAAVLRRDGEGGPRQRRALFGRHDPWKCSGCLECVDVCGPHALVERQQDAPLLETLQTRFEFLSRTPNTPARFFEGAPSPTARPSG